MRLALVSILPEHDPNFLTMKDLLVNEGKFDDCTFVESLEYTLHEELDGILDSNSSDVFYWLNIVVDLNAA